MYYSFIISFLSEFFQHKISLDRDTPGTTETHTGHVGDANVTHINSLIAKKTHTKERPYKCDICDARFTDSSNLKRHNMTHTKERPYQCDVCDARFTESGSLRRHKRNHTQKRTTMSV